MPSSDPGQIPSVLQAVAAYKPTSILDVGPGFGKWGFLLREYLECNQVGPIAAVDRTKRSLRIDAVEVYAPYITDLHRLLYDRIIIGDISEICDTLGEYDVILMIDVLEHLPRKVAVRTVNVLAAKAGKGVIVATPNGEYVQGEVFGNIHEHHVDTWTAKQLRRQLHAQVLVTGGQLLACVSRTGTTNEWLASNTGIRFLLGLPRRAYRKYRRLAGTILRKRA
jgi:2-polyprenyl-3-methyl-5-hydroxy-6-metoxy-1,4-benzoquinol methylase